MTAVKHLKPHRLVCLGDLVDCYAISAFDKNPERRGSFQADLDAASAFLARLTDAAPRAERFLLEGNHEDRLRRLLWRMTEEQREVLGLRKVRQATTWPEMLDLGEHDWHFVPALGQAKRRLLRKVITKHGSVVRRWSAHSAKAEWERYGKSGISGHTHRLGLFYARDYNGSHVWAEAGCTCDLSPEYVEDPAWQQGFLIVTEVGDRFAIEPVYIERGVALVRGCSL